MKVFMSKTHSPAIALFGSAFLFKAILLKMPLKYNTKGLPEGRNEPRQTRQTK